MKRLYLHVNVSDHDRAVSFYGTLFDAPPTVTKPDYAKWMLADPAGVQWQTFDTFGDATAYDEDVDIAAGSACYTPETAAAAACC